MSQSRDCGVLLVDEVHTFSPSQLAPPSDYISPHLSDGRCTLSIYHMHRHYTQQYNNNSLDKLIANCVLLVILPIVLPTVCLNKELYPITLLSLN